MADVAVGTGAAGRGAGVHRPPVSAPVKYLTNWGLSLFLDDDDMVIMLGLPTIIIRRLRIQGRADNGSRFTYEL